MSSVIGITVVFSALCYGFSNMVVFQDGPFKIFKRIKKLFYSIDKSAYEVLTCMICFPTWAGFIFSLMNILFIDKPFTPFNYLIMPEGLMSCCITILLDGILASGMVWVIHNIEEYFENNKNQEKQIGDA